MICRNHPEIAEGIRRCTRCGETFCTDCLVTIQGEPFCASCKAERLLDVRSGVDLMRMAYAGFWARFGAQVLDGLIYGIPSYAILLAGVMYVTQSNGPPSWFLLSYLPLFVFPVIYEGLMLPLKNGQTIGKMALRLRVVRPDGSRISAAQAWGRATVRVVLGCLVVVDFLPYFFTDEKTTLHDMVAGTRVVESLPGEGLKDEG